jgi:hypothetical protein
MPLPTVNSSSDDLRYENERLKGCIDSLETQLASCRAALARFQSEKPELGDLSLREQIRTQMICDYLSSGKEI